MMADNISTRVQGLLSNLADKRQKCEKKMLRLKATAAESTDEGSSPDTALDLTVLEAETSRVQVYDRQIAALQKQFSRNKEINLKLLDEISHQLRDALDLQDYERKTGQAAVAEQETPLAGARDSSVEPPRLQLEHRLTEKLNPDSDDALDFDWPTDADLSEVMRTHAAEGRDLGALQIIGVNNNRY